MKYRNYSEVTDFLKKVANQNPDSASLESIGQTTEGRDIWLITLTNNKTGHHSTKPATWVDGNTHASEITGCESCLFFIQTLLDKKNSEEYKFLLDSFTFYIVPRISADGAEYYLKHNHEVRSTPVRWPPPSNLTNFLPKDLDGNGHILTMRKKDPAGNYKISSKNPRLMIQRSSDDLNNGEFYKLYEEGLFENFDGFKEEFRGQFDFDLNRQYPHLFRPEGQQWGAGPYPLFLPEAKALVQAFSTRSNIVNHITLHTFGGMILRPPSNQPDVDFDTNDIEIYKKITKKAAEVSGYKFYHTYEDFRYDPRDRITGTFDDWSFVHRGVISYTVEIWDVFKEAGVPVNEVMRRFHEPNEDELNSVLLWCENNLPKWTYYQDWIPFQHPQLGAVEIGGWKLGRVFRNPPEHLLEQECQKVFKIIQSQTLSSPLVKTKSLKTTKLHNNMTHIQWVLRNEGYLATNGSAQALKTGAVTKPRVHLISDTTKIITGLKNFECDHLRGRSNDLPWHTPLFYYYKSNQNEALFEWVLEGQGPVIVEANYGRGGVVVERFKI